MVLAVTSERRHTPSRTHKYKPGSLYLAHVTPGRGRAGAQNHWQEGGPKGTRKQEFKAGVTAHLGLSGDAATCSLQPSPAEVPGGGSKGLRGWKGAPVPFWVARFSRRLTSTGPSRVPFPAQGRADWDCRASTSLGAGFSPRRLCPRPSAAHWEAGIPGAPLEAAPPLRPCRAGPDQGGASGAGLTLELKEPPPGSAFWLPRGPAPPRPGREWGVCVVEG